jgi:hypothetical protein
VKAGSQGFKLFFGLGLVLPPGLFVLAFALAYRQNAEQMAQTAQLASAHLRYARELKDDMGLMDWSKSLEKLDSVLAFRVTAGPKVLAQGGNQDLFPANLPEGLRFVPPSTWNFRQVSSEDPQNPEEFALVLRTRPSPLLWGLLAMLGGWLTGGLAYWGARDRRVEARTDEFAKPKTAGPSSFPSGASSGPEALSAYRDKPFLFLDNTWKIQRVSPPAAKLLGKKESELKGRHFLDLAPKPEVMNLLEQKRSCKVTQPFLGHSSLDSDLEVLPEGFIFVLGVNEDPERQKG